MVFVRLGFGLGRGSTVELSRVWEKSREGPGLQRGAVSAFGAKIGALFALGAPQFRTESCSAVGRTGRLFSQRMGEVPDALPTGLIRRHRGDDWHAKNSMEQSAANRRLKKSFIYGGADLGEWPEKKNAGG